MSIAADLATALDPVLLSKRVGIEPDDWQQNVLRSASDRIALNCCRQSGKSTIAAILAVYTALYDPGSLTLLLSPALRQSQELFRKALMAYRALGRPVPPEAENQLSLTLETGSRIICLPGQESTIRGFSGVRLLVVDEAARVPDELYYGVRPMLAVSGGRLMLLSTPYGSRGFFYEAWQSDDKWEQYEVPAPLVPRISPEFLKEEERALGHWWFRQEYHCEFLDSETQAFRVSDIERLFDTEVEAWTL